MKHTFIYEFDSHFSSKVKVTYETDAESLDRILEDFTYYLRSCGFIIKHTQYLDFMDDSIEEENKKEDCDNDKR